jgi:hypothetical protein
MQPDNKGKGLHRLKPERVEGGRSNMFIVDNVDPVSYFHLSFKRKIKKKHYYFAELEGKGGPQRVTMCREINKQTGIPIFLILLVRLHNAMLGSPNGGRAPWWPFSKKNRKFHLQVKKN